MGDKQTPPYKKIMANTNFLNKPLKMKKIIRYKINQRIGLTYRIKYLTRSEFIKYYKRWNPTGRTTRMKKEMKERRVVLNK